MIRFIHAADLHIDSPMLGLERYPGAPADEMRAATRRAFDNLVQRAIREKVNFVILAGDIFDSDWRDMNTGLHFAAGMTELREASIPVYVLYGNHDAKHMLRQNITLPSNVNEFSEKEAQTFRLDDLGVALHGMSFKEHAVTENLSLKYPAREPGFFNIGVLHTNLGGITTHANYAPTSVEILTARGYDYWALGHVHNRKTFSEYPRIAYPGNSQGRDARETGPKGCELVTVLEGNRTESTFVPLDSARWELVSFDITSYTTPSDLWAAAHERFKSITLDADGRLLAMRIVLHGEGPLHEKLAADPDAAAAEMRQAANDASGNAAWVEKVLLKTTPSFDRALLAAQSGAVGELLKLTGELRSDTTILRTFGEEHLAELLDRLPPAVKSGPEPLDLKSADVLEQLISEAEAVAIARLAGAVR